MPDYRSCCARVRQVVLEASIRISFSWIQALTFRETEITEIDNVTNKNKGED